VVQSVVVLAAVAYLVTTLDRIVGLPSSRLARVWIVMAAGTIPLVPHFATSVLTDSLAASFFVLTSAALARLATMNRPSRGDVVVFLMSVTLLVFMRQDLALPVMLVALGVLVVAVRGRRTTIAVVVAVGLICVVSMALVNRATQTADYGRPAVSPLLMLFDRVWGEGRLAVEYENLPAQVRERVSPELAATWADDPNGLQSVILRMADRDGQAAIRDSLVTGVSCCWLDVSSSFLRDALAYSVTPVTYAAVTVAGTPSATAWTNSRLAQAHPSHSALFVTLWVLLLCAMIFRGLCAVRRRPPRPLAIVPPLVLIGAVLGLAAFLSARTAFGFHPRYGLPIAIIVWTFIVWFSARKQIGSEGAAEGVVRAELGASGGARPGESVPHRLRPRHG
jgi:hypothetical protein